MNKIIGNVEVHMSYRHNMHCGMTVFHIGIKEVKWTRAIVFIALSRHVTKFNEVIRFVSVRNGAGKEKRASAPQRLTCTPFLNSESPKALETASSPITLKEVKEQERGRRRRVR
jgi:hypothetical protein